MIDWEEGLANVAIVGLGFVLAVCSGSSTKETVTSSAAGTGNDATFIHTINGDPSSTNPINTSSRWDLAVTNAIYPPFVTVEAGGTTQNVLAEPVGPVEDSLLLTVHLKQDAKQSGDEDFTADDVVLIHEQKIKKEGDNADSFRVDDRPIAIEKVDECTVKFALPTPSAAAISNIATETYIIPERISKDISNFSVSGLPEKSVGTGPY